MKIQITINNDKTITATMADNQAARDFIDQLPLSLELNDFAGTEKASGSLPKALNVKDSPKGYKPSAGDLTHYAPWNNLAIFYKNDSYANGLVYLGKFDSDFSMLNNPGTVKIKIESLKGE